MEVNVGKTYLSNNPCFPGQLFHINGIEHAKRFGKDNVLVSYERWAWSRFEDKPWLVSRKCTSWLVSNKKSFLAEQLPAELQSEFDAIREAVLQQNG